MVSTESFTFASDIILKMSLAVVIKFVSGLIAPNPAMFLYHVGSDKSGAFLSVAASWRHSKKTRARSAFSDGSIETSTGSGAVLMFIFPLKVNDVPLPGVIPYTVIESAIPGVSVLP